MESFQIWHRPGNWAFALGPRLRQTISRWAPEPTRLRELLHRRGHSRHRNCARSLVGHAPGLSSRKEVSQLPRLTTAEHLASVVVGWVKCEDWSRAIGGPLHRHHS